VQVKHVHTCVISIKSTFFNKCFGTLKMWDYFAGVESAEHENARKT